MTDPTPIQSLDHRSREIFRRIVEAYLETGEPIGSRTLSQQGVDLSAASIRNVMSDLAAIGLLEAPHKSAGRAPTQLGLRLFVDSLLEIGELRDEDRAAIEGRLRSVGRDFPDVMSEASELLSGLTGGAGLVASPKEDGAIKQVQFVPLGNDKALSIIVYAGGAVENRIVTLPKDCGPATLIEAGNYLSDRLSNRTLDEARDDVQRELADKRAQLDVAATDLIEQGLVEWSGDEPGRGRSLIVRGRANLLQNSSAAEDLDRVRQLFGDLERKQSLINLLDSTEDGTGTRIFIGAESRLFSLSGSSLIVSPYMTSERKIVGALGVIGPTHLDYARVIPMVDYTAKVIGRILDGEE